MSAQTIALQAPSALSTPTLRVFAADTDAQVAGSPFTLVEAANRKGHYEVTAAGTLSGLHEVVLYSGANPVAGGWIDLVDADGVYTVQGDRSLVESAVRVLKALPAAAAGANGGLPTLYSVVPDGLLIEQGIALSPSSLKSIWNTLTTAQTWSFGSFAAYILRKLGYLGTVSGGTTGAVSTGNAIEFFVGEDCLASLGREISFTLDLPFDATLCTWSIDVGPRKGATVFSKAGTAVLVSGSTYTITFEPGAAETGEADVYAEYGYTVTAKTAAGKVSARIEGVATTRRLWSVAA